MRGKKKPPATHKLEGTFRADRHAINGEVSYKIADTPMPDDLNDYGKAEWARLFPLVTGSRVMTDADISAFHLYCMEWGKYREAHKEILRDGVIIFNEKGDKVEHPANKVAKSAYTALKELMIQFGLTPCSRSKVVMAKGEVKQMGLGSLMAKGKTA